MKNKIIAVLHLIIFILAISSPLWANWRIVAIGFLLYILQGLIFKGCLLSYAQFGNDSGKPAERFLIFYTSKIFPKINKEKFDIFLDKILAPAIPITAFVIQYLLSYKPLFDL